MGETDLRAVPDAKAALDALLRDEPHDERPPAYELDVRRATAVDARNALRAEVRAALAALPPPAHPPRLSSVITPRMVARASAEYAAAGRERKPTAGRMRAALREAFLVARDDGRLDVLPAGDPTDFEIARELRLLAGMNSGTMDSVFARGILSITGQPHSLSALADSRAAAGAKP